MLTPTLTDSLTAVAVLLHTHTLGNDMERELLVFLEWHKQAAPSIGHDPQCSCVVTECGQALRRPATQLNSSRRNHDAASACVLDSSSRQAAISSRRQTPAHHDTSVGQLLPWAPLPWQRTVACSVVRLPLQHIPLHWFRIAGTVIRCDALMPCAVAERAAPPAEPLAHATDTAALAAAALLAPMIPPQSA
jgi:hypothetical protein